MRQRLIIIGTLFLISMFMTTGIQTALGAQKAGTGVYTHDKTGLVFPQELGGAKFNQTNQYDDPALGVGILYEGISPRAVITLYIYDYGIKNIGTGLGPKVKEHFGQAKNEIFAVEKAGNYKNVKILYEKEISLKSGQGARTAALACFSFEANGVAMTSYLWLTGYRDHFVKLRYSRPTQTGENGEKAFNKFQQALAGLLK